jgi:hypothetical protein
MMAICVCEFGGPEALKLEGVPDHLQLCRMIGRRPANARIRQARSGAAEGEA